MGPEDDETEDIDDLDAAGDTVDVVDQMLSVLRHLLGDVSDHEELEAQASKMPGAVKTAPSIGKVFTTPIDIAGMAGSEDGPDDDANVDD